MEKKIKFLLIGLGTVTIVAVLLTVWIFIAAQSKINFYAAAQAELEKKNTYLNQELSNKQQELSRWKTKSDSASASLNKINKEHLLLSNQYSSLLKEKESLSQENEKINKKLDKLDALYAQEKQKAEQISSESFLSQLLQQKAGLEIELERLRGDVAGGVDTSEEKLIQLEMEKRALETRLEKAQKIADALSRDLIKIMQEKNTLAVELSKFKSGFSSGPLIQEGQSIQLSPIVVKPQEKQSFRAWDVVKKQTDQGLQGNIITVNPKHKFVVINLGMDKGLRRGRQFSVYRDNRKIGMVEVIETRKHISACDIKGMDKTFKVNDIVRAE